MVEVLVATSIIVVAVLAFLAIVQKASVVSRQALHITQAGFLLEEGAEAVRILRDNAWSNISALTLNANYYPTFSGGTWILSATPNTVGIFTRTVTLSSVKRDATTRDISSTGVDEPLNKLVAVTVSWTEGGTTASKTLSFYITDIF